MNKQKYRINLATLIRDNGDGGFTARVYNNDDELLADQYSLQDLEKGSLEWNKKAKEILEGEDEYDNGYVGTTSFEIEIEDGVARLAGILSFQGGQ